MITNTKTTNCHVAYHKIRIVCHNISANKTDPLLISQAVILLAECHSLICQAASSIFVIWTFEHFQSATSPWPTNCRIADLATSFQQLTAIDSAAEDSFAFTRDWKHFQELIRMTSLCLEAGGSSEYNLCLDWVIRIDSM